MTNKGRILKMFCLNHNPARMLRPLFPLCIPAPVSLLQGSLLSHFCCFPFAIKDTHQRFWVAPFQERRKGTTKPPPRRV